MKRLDQARQTLQRQLQDADPIAVQQAMQRQAGRQMPISSPKSPETPGDWVKVMQSHAQTLQRQGAALRLGEREFAQHTALQRQVAQQLSAGFRQDRRPALERQQEHAQQLAALQRYPLAAPVTSAVLRTLPPGERLVMQRLVDTVTQREQTQEAADRQLLGQVALQRQLESLNAEGTLPVLQRIQARRGSGSPLPEAVRRHLEQGLNHDLHSVRIHDDAEADKLAKGMQAIAFTTGTDIFFQAGQFNPNTQTGLELLAHEVTHTVQQSQGRVGSGIDPDAGLEAEARATGTRLAQTTVKRMIPGSRPLAPLAPGRGIQRLATPPSWNTSATPAVLEQMIQKDMQGFLRQMLGRTLLDQNHYNAQNRSDPHTIPSLGRIFLNSLDHVPVSSASRQKVLNTAIYAPGLPDWIRLEVATTAVALKRVDIAKGQVTIRALRAKIAKAASVDHVGDFGKAIGSRLVDTVVGIYKLAKFVAWDNSTIRMLVDFKGYAAMWQNIGATGAVIVKNPALIWEALTKEAKEAWRTGEYGKSLGYITFDVASVATGIPGAARGAATVPGKAKIVLAIAKDAQGNLVTRVVEVGDQIAAGMQMAAGDLAVRPTLAAANAGRPASPSTPVSVNAGRTSSTTALTDPRTLRGLPKQLNLAQRCSNWDEVIKVLGKKATAKTLPPGYRYAKIPLKNGKYDQYAYLPNAKAIPNAVPKLKADAAGNWQPAGLEWAKKSDGTYTVSRDYRLAQSSEYNATNPPPAGFAGRGAVNNHHMTPDEIMRASPVFQQLFARGLISPDRASNMINLAVDSTTLSELRAAGFTMSDITHYTSHPKYTSYVERLLEKQLQDWRLAGKLPDDLSKASAKQLMQFVDSFDRYLLRHFFQDADLLKHLLRTNGSLGSAPSSRQESELV